MRPVASVVEQVDADPGRVVTGPAVILIVAVIAALLTVAYLLLEVDYETRRDVRQLQRREEARRRLSAPRSLP